MNKLTIPSPLLYCCYATYVPALSDLLVETLVVSIGVPLSLHRVVNRIYFWKASGSREDSRLFFVYVSII